MQINSLSINPGFTNVQFEIWKLDYQELITKPESEQCS